MLRSGDTCLPVHPIQLAYCPIYKAIGNVYVYTINAANH